MAAAPELLAETTEVAFRHRPLRLHAVHTAPAAGCHPPLLLLHGMASSWRQWRATMVRLGPGLPLAALDFPGFGDSAAPRQPMEAPDYADVCEAWCRIHRWPALAAVGHSFGGAVLVDWASRYPRRFTSLGLLAPAVIRHPWYSAGRGPIRWPLVGRLALPFFLWLISTRALGPRYFGHIVSDLTAVTEEETRDLQWGCRRAREMLRALDYYEFAGLAERMASIEVPVTIGWGTHDRVVPHSDSAILTARLPRHRLCTWAGCGHVPMLERRAECDALLRTVWRDRRPVGAAAT